MADGAEHTHKGVAENSVAQMADMGRLIGIDVGVLDDELAAARSQENRRRFASTSSAIGSPIEARIDISVASDFKRGDALNGSQTSDNSRGDGLRRLRNWRARWNATGMASSPKEACLGCSRVTGISTP